MKKFFVLVIMLFAGSLFAADAAVPLQTGPLNFPSALGGVIYSNATRAMYRESKADLKEYEVLGKVESSSQMYNVLLLCNWGDTSLGTLKKQALAVFPQADDIVNVEIDATTYNICLVYCQTTVYLRGIAVKYKK